MANRYEDNNEHQRYLKRLRLIDSHKKAATNPVDNRQRSLNKKVPAVSHRQRVGNGKRIASVLIPFILVLALSVYTISPFSKLTSVQVSGNHELTTREVEQATGIKPGTFIWWRLSHTSKVLKDSQKRNPQIKSLHVKLSGPQSVRIKITEYPTIGIVNHKGQQQLLLSNGKYRPIKGNVDNFLHYSNFGGHYTHLKIAARQVGQLSPAIRSSISDISYSPTKLDSDRLKIIMNDGNTVLVRADSLSKKMKYYPSIVSKMTGNGVINLQYGAYSYNYSNK